MAPRSLADFIRQCRLARWEVEYNVVDTLELPPAEKVSYPLLLCAGQEVTIKIRASQSLAVSIGFESRESELEPPEPFIYSPEAASFVIDHEAKRTACYLLAMVNTSAAAGIDIAVEITAALRQRSSRTRFESAVRSLADGAFHSERFFQVVARTAPKQPPDRESDDDPTDTRRATGAQQ